MVLRLLVYVSQLHEQNLRMNKKSGVLSRIVSAVVYNGRRNWDAPRDLSEMFGGNAEGDPRLFGQYRYLLVDGHSKRSREDLISLLFGLERAGEKEFSQLIRKLARRLRGEEHAELRRSFRAWIENVLLTSRMPSTGISAIADLEQAMMHLPKRISWIDEARLEGMKLGKRAGRKVGKEEGRKKGRVEGRRDMARFLLQRRFGKLSDDLSSRLSRADDRQLAVWIDRAYSCATLEEVFNRR